MIRERLMREAEGNVALRVTDTENADSFEVAGRGELQLGILIETMRREGFELAVVAAARRVPDATIDGELLEPIEEVVIDVDEEYSGIVVAEDLRAQGRAARHAPLGRRPPALVFYAPTRGLIGYQGELLTDTRGTGVMNRLFHEYAPLSRATIPGRRNGVLISNAAGEAVTYALWNLEERGPMFIDPGMPVYDGMIVGEHSRGNDLEVNVLKGKQLTNIRAAGKDEAVRLTPPRMTLERALAYIEEDELVEVTPKSIRLRKRHLDSNDRKKAERQKLALPTLTIIPPCQGRNIRMGASPHQVKNRRPAPRPSPACSRACLFAHQGSLLR